MTATNDTERRETQDDAHVSPTLSGRSATPETDALLNAMPTLRDMQEVREWQVGALAPHARRLEIQRDNLIAVMAAVRGEITHHVFDHDYQRDSIRCQRCKAIETLDVLLTAPALAATKVPHEARY